MHRQLRILLVFQFLLITAICVGQPGSSDPWTPDGQARVEFTEKGIVHINVRSGAVEVLVTRAQLDQLQAGLEPAAFRFSVDMQRMLVFTNTARVWRYETRGDYHVFDRKTGRWRQLGRGLPAQSLMFAKLSPDGKRAAYVSNYNLYVEDLAGGVPRALTKDGHRRMINGTFDWVYEEEFACRDGFRWSPDGQRISFWQVNAAGTRDFLMMNNTDSIYSRVIPVEYPKVGEPPSAVRIGVVSVAGGPVSWMKVPGDPRQHYLPRMEWVPDGKRVIVQQLDRKQQQSILFACDVTSGNARPIFSERDSAWVDILPTWDDGYAYGGWDWIEGGRAFVWASETDGWRHLWRVPMDGSSPKLITAGQYDLIDIDRIDERSGYIYFSASPEDATRRYLYRIRLDGSAAAERLTPEGQPGTHEYDIAPGGAMAIHRFTNHRIPGVSEWVSLPDHRSAGGGRGPVTEAIAKLASTPDPLEFFRVKTADGVELDGWMVRPVGFDPTKKYPVVFHVYSEPASQTVTDRFGTGRNRIYEGDMSKDGYIYISLDNRGTPAPKGRAWRKSIYRKIGVVNIRDQAMAAAEILKSPYVDTSRVAVWGWSGGGSATLNLMFRHPNIYKTGISIAAVANQLTYDNIYQERYMGLPSENRADFVEGSPVTHARHLRGNLLYIHGTADDNVHYQNAEMLINELVRHGRQFNFMAYPGRAHGIREGEGTTAHLRRLCTDFLQRYCPPGPR
jgi:dipeptidyl-peptidase 4